MNAGERGNGNGANSRTEERGAKRWFDYQKLLWTFALTAMVAFAGMLLKEHARVSTLTSALQMRLASIESDRFRQHEGQQLREDQIKVQGDVQAVAARLTEATKVHIEITESLQSVAITMREVSVRMQQLENREIPPKEVLHRLDALERRLDKSETRYDVVINRLIMHFERFERQGQRFPEGRGLPQHRQYPYVPRHHAEEPFGNSEPSIYKSAPFLGVQPRMNPYPWDMLPEL